MKFLVFARLRIGANIPEEKVPALFQEAREWISESLTNGTADCLYNLPAGGGVAIVNADSHEILTEILGAYPLQPWIQYEVHPLSDAIKSLGG